jgi:hypothetical protein
MEDQDLSFGQAEARLWAKWVAANFVAALFAEVPSILMPELNETESATVFVSLILWLSWGLFLAFMQWLVLRRWIPRAPGWLIATTAAVFLYLTLLGLATPVVTAVSDALAQTSNVAWTGRPELWSGIAYGALLGATFGIAQWFILRRRFSKGGWWILATSAGWTAAALLGQGPDCLQLLAQPAPGAVSGIALVWLLRRTLGEGWETAPPPVVKARGKTQTCPHCGEQVPFKAAVCRHCQGWLVHRPQMPEAGEQQRRNGIVRALRRGVPRGVRWAVAIGALGALGALALPTVALVLRAKACGPLHSSVIAFAVLALTSSAPAGALPAVLAWIFARRRPSGRTAGAGDFSVVLALACGLLGVTVAFPVSAVCALMTFFPECL